MNKEIMRNTHKALCSNKVKARDDIGLHDPKDDPPNWGYYSDGESLLSHVLEGWEVFKELSKELKKNFERGKRSIRASLVPSSIAPHQFLLMFYEKKLWGWLQKDPKIMSKSQHFPYIINLLVIYGIQTVILPISMLVNQVEVQK
ncbi:unnamed protein product [Ilex paraguariensis]|uniref:Uncharacterized protein n=1 Tax=Ilex paraguariensis TaxID=185542 RepID=A0ABC8T6D2_9AQUA